MTVAARLDQVLDSIDIAAARSSRSAEQITLVAVSKKQPLALMHDYVEAAARRSIPVVFGENYVQELKEKRAQFTPDQSFHLLGPVQSNKMRDAVKYADVIQSACSESNLHTIIKEARAQGKRQAVLIQVNVGNDPRKSGFSLQQIPDVLVKLTEHASSLKLLGLMTITPYYQIVEDARPDFIKMRQLRDELRSGPLADLFVNSTPLLSMGMSADFHIAIEEGADIVRIGTAIFGERQ